MLKMIHTQPCHKSIVLDLGCGRAYFSRALQTQSMTIGVDVDKDTLAKAQAEENVRKRLYLVDADAFSLPFMSHSIGMVVCVSMLEHMRDLDSAAREISRILEKDGTLLVGYPIETRLFKLIWRFVSPTEFKFIDQSQTFWCNPTTGEQECYWENPSTHKQSYQTIRYVLGKYFRVLAKEKLPFREFPDIFSFYECLRCTPNH
jgi:ubiquinone/menaquinone biosynthesis C-methylase UbiE